MKKLATSRLPHLLNKQKKLKTKTAFTNESWSNVRLKMKNRLSKRKLILMLSCKSLKRWRWKGSCSIKRIGTRLIKRSSKQWTRCFSRSRWTVCDRTSWSLQTVTSSSMERQGIQSRKISTLVLKHLVTGMKNQYLRIDNRRQLR